MLIHQYTKLTNYCNYSPKTLIIYPCVIEDALSFSFRLAEKLLILSVVMFIPILLDIKKEILAFEESLRDTRIQQYYILNQIKVIFFSIVGLSILIQYLEFWYCQV